MRIGIVLIALLFATSGTLHLIMPAPFIRIVPTYIPKAQLMVLLSGIAELAGAVGILIPATRVVGAWWLILLLAAVFPANIYMLQQGHWNPNSSTLYLVGLWLRLPLQFLLMWYIWKAGVKGE